MNIKLLKEVLLISLTSSVISNALVQKLKVCEKHKNHLCLKSMIISVVIGILFSISFTDLNLTYTLWSGALSFIGADALYLSIEKGILKNIINKEKER